MKTEEQLEKICMDIYKEMYKKAQPSVDLDKLIKSGETQKEDWYMKYYLDDKKAEKIINKHIKKHKLTREEKRKVAFEVWTGCSPTSYKERWEEEIKK